MAPLLPETTPCQTNTLGNVDFLCNELLGSLLSMENKLTAIFDFGFGFFLQKNPNSDWIKYKFNEPGTSLTFS